MDLKKPVILFLLVFTVYQINFSYITHGDSVPVALTGYSLSEYKTFVLDDIYPESYMGFKELPYHSKLNKSGHILSLFGIGAPLTSAPFYFIFDLLAGIDWNQNSILFFGKILAALLTTLTVVLLFFILKNFTSENWALILASVYAFSTCAWSISSQALWQQTISGFYIILSIYFLLIGRKYPKYIALAAIPISMCVLTRPTMAVFAAVCAIYVFYNHRDKLFKIILVSIPFVVVLAAYNYTNYGSIFSSGQYIESVNIALEKTGKPDLWRLPFVGFFGLLLAPSVGILFFSPVLFFAVWGGVIVAQDFSTKKALDPLMIYLLWAGLILLFIQSAWFDWWGGWSYGYRPIVDFVSLFVILICPVTKYLDRPRLKAVFYTLAFYGLLVQFLGAFVSDFSSWQLKDNDVDKHPDRLWSLVDNQILYNISNFNLRKTVWEISQDKKTEKSSQ